MKLYVATSFERAHRACFVMNELRKRGHAITFDWTEYRPLVDDGWQPSRDDEEAIAAEEIDGIQEADALIVLLPGGKGTHVELGAALALRKPIALFGESKRDCVFYQHSTIVLRSTVSRPDLIAELSIRRLGEAVGFLSSKPGIACTWPSTAVF